MTLKWTAAFGCSPSSFLVREHRVSFGKQSLPIPSQSTYLISLVAVTDLKTDTIQP